MKGNRIGWAVALSCGLLATTGCVFKETYEAEKSRSLNFQRLLAQEEKRTAELDSELKRIKRDASDYEARNRELSAQVQSAREQMGRLQEETDALRDAMVLQQKAQEQMKVAAVAPKRKSAEAPAQTVPAAPKLNLRPLDSTPPALESLPESAPAEILPSASALGAAAAKAEQAPMPEGRKAIRHQVKPGDTVYRLSRRYGTSVEKIREWNNRKDDLLEVGEKLIVGFE